MAVVLQQLEAVPASYPGVSDLSDKAQDLNLDALWQRLEAYTAYRFTPRDVTWTLEAQAGEYWTPPLAPVVSLSWEIWDGSDWETITLLSGPLGQIIPNDGTYRATAEIGNGPVPATVGEAFRRLAEYSVEIGDDGMVMGHPSHASHSSSIGELDESFTRAQAWAARALQLSGAADLLRAYRRV
ncbi:MAG: hypothetical protein AAF755_00135 [Pseudomonadota bacterium]